MLLTDTALCLCYNIPLSISFAFLMRGTIRRVFCFGLDLLDSQPKDVTSGLTHFFAAVVQSLDCLLVRSEFNHQSLWVLRLRSSSCFPHALAPSRKCGLQYPVATISVYREITEKVKEVKQKDKLNHSVSPQPCCQSCLKFAARCESVLRLCNKRSRTGTAH